MFLFSCINHILPLIRNKKQLLLYEGFLKVGRLSVPVKSSKAYLLAALTIKLLLISAVASVPAPVIAIAAAIAAFLLLLSCSSAVRASDRLIVKAFFLIESLFSFREYKLSLAILAHNYLICHSDNLLQF